MSISDPFRQAKSSGEILLNRDLTRPEARPAPSTPKGIERTKSQARTELKLVYRTLRLISDWALSGFFSEVCVEGEENVPQEGAVILTPCHHNEIIDIAALSATIPHRRIIAYWAKASLFKNPIARFILRSAGAIPVARVPRAQTSQTPERNGDKNGINNSVMGNDNLKILGATPKHIPNDQQRLFDATYKELDKGGGGVLGVFPEGTSYTLPRIVQVKEGAARATLGYIRWLGSHGVEKQLDGSGDVDIPVSVVPVGIVYTDKSRYRSRLYIRYGKAVHLRSLLEQCCMDVNGSEAGETQAFQNGVRKLTQEIEKGMIALTINSLDWHALYAARTARAILWEDERSLHLQDFVKVSTTLNSMFEHPATDIQELKISLLRYHALLYHTGLTHTMLTHVPLPPSDGIRFERARPGLGELYRTVISRRASVKLAGDLPLLIAPLLLSLPTHLAHAPAYLFGTLASRIFAGEEEEGRAQFKVIVGGIGRALGTFAMSVALVRFAAGRSLLNTVAKVVVDASTTCIGFVGRSLSAVISARCGSDLEEVGDRCTALANFAVNLARISWIKLGGLRDWISILCLGWLLCAWHARAIESNYIRYNRARATLTVLRAVLFSSRVPKTTREELGPYLSTPPPPINPYIAKSLQSASEDAITNDGPYLNEDGASRMQVIKNSRRQLPKSELVRHLLLTRADAVEMLRSTFRDLEQGKSQPDSTDVPNHPDSPSSNDMTDKGGRESDIVGDIQFLRECGAVF